MADPRGRAADVDSVEEEPIEPLVEVGIFRIQLPLGRGARHGRLVAYAQGAEDIITLTPIGLNLDDELANIDRPRWELDEVAIILARINQPVEILVFGFESAVVEAALAALVERRAANAPRAC